MIRINLSWQWLEDYEPAGVVDAEIISDTPAAADPELERRLADLAYLEALAASLES